jgi:hypothetical protein
VEPERVRGPAGAVQRTGAGRDAACRDCLFKDVCGDGVRALKVWT